MTSISTVLELGDDLRDQEKTRAIRAIVDTFRQLVEKHGGGQWNIESRTGDADGEARWRTSNYFAKLNTESW